MNLSNYWFFEIDATSGGTIDYTQNAGISYSYVPELRGDSFIVDPAEIPLSFEEVWNGLVAMVDEIDAIGAWTALVLPEWNKALDVPLNTCRD